MGKSRCLLEKNVGKSVCASAYIGTCNNIMPIEGVMIQLDAH